MPENKTPFILGGIAVGLMIVIAVWAAARGPAPVDSSLTQVTDLAEISTLVELKDPSIATSENYVGHRIQLIRGWVRNVSDKPIRLLDVKMQFTDYDGKTLQEGVYSAFEPKQRPIDPGTEYRFEVAFEELPRGWNYQVPVMQVVKVAY